MARRFLLTCHDAGGTIPPMLALAHALRAAGHSVAVLSQPCVRTRAEAAGCEFVAFSSVGDYAKDRPIEEQLEVVGEATVGASVGEDLERAAHRMRADVVVVDANLGGALAAAESLSCPSAVLFHSMYATFVTTWFADLWGLLEPGMNDVRERYRLRPADGWPAVFASHDLLLPVVPRVFDAPVGTVPAAMRHFGFVVPPAPAGPPLLDYPDGDGPTVLVGSSTTYLAQESQLGAIVEALAALPVRAIVTTAGHGGDVELRAAANVAIVDYVPHAPLLDHTDLMITHAGMASVAGALSHGVPLVCTPIGRDQPLNAQRVVDCGAGVDLGPEPDAGAIATAVEAVLAQPDYRAAARSLARASEAEGGVTAAAHACFELT